MMEAKDRLKDYIHGTIVTSGYNLSYIDFKEGHLNKLIQLCEDAKKELYSNCHVEKLNRLLLELDSIIDSSVMGWETKYDICWKIKDKMFEIVEFDWYDPDGSYQEDVMSFYKAAEEYIWSL